MSSPPPPHLRHGRGRHGTRPSVQDVARLAGVAVGTVSNFFNSPEKLRATTRRRVEEAIAELGFVRNYAARTLVAGTMDAIGLVLVDIGNSLFVDIARGVETATASSGLRLLLANSDIDQTRQDAYLQLLDQAQVAGLLLAPLDGPLDVARAVRRRGRPVVLVNAPERAIDMCCVAVDEQLGGYLSAQHLIDAGARRLAFVGGPLDLHAVGERFDGARRAAREASVELVLVETHALNIRDGRGAARDILQWPDRPDGIVCAADLLAVGVIQAASEAGVAVPEDLLVIGYDDNHFASESAIPVSTVAQPGEHMGAAAARLLLDEIRGADEHRHRAVVLQPHLIIRQSSQRP